MAPRAYWKGYLKLSLVTIGIELYNAVSRSSQLQLHQIHEPSGKRIRYQKVAPGVGPVAADEIVKGYEIDDDDYVLLTDDELDALKLESRETIDLIQFVDQCEIDPRYFDKPYYVVPRDSSVAREGFTVVREALRRSGKVGLGQLAVRGRDYICAIRPCGPGMLLETLRYPDEIRESDSIFDHISDDKPDKDMLGLAQELIERKAEPFDASAFKSRYSAALRELIDEKRKKGKVSAASDERLGEKAEGNVVDLMSALKKSVEKDRGEKKKRPPPKGGRRKTSAAE
jgi:DNA end-binding protein Ku